MDEGPYCLHPISFTRRRDMVTANLNARNCFVGTAKD